MYKCIMYHVQVQCTCMYNVTTYVYRSLGLTTYDKLVIFFSFFLPTTNGGSNRSLHGRFIIIISLA